MRRRARRITEQHARSLADGHRADGSRRAHRGDAELQLPGADCRSPGQRGAARARRRFGGARLGGDRGVGMIGAAGQQPTHERGDRPQAIAHVVVGQQRRGQQRGHAPRGDLGLAQHVHAGRAVGQVHAHPRALAHRRRL